MRAPHPPYYPAEAIKHAIGNWATVLEQIGIDRLLLRGKPCPCPMCGGRDRFQFTIKGHGADWGRWHCRQCGGGDGFRLAMQFHRESFPDTVARIAKVLGITASTTVRRHAAHLPPAVLRGAAMDLRMLCMEAMRTTPEDLDAQDAALKLLEATLAGTATAPQAAIQNAFDALLAQALQTNNPADRETLLRSGDTLRRILLLRVKELKGAGHAA